MTIETIEDDIAGGIAETFGLSDTKRDWMRQFIAEQLKRQATDAAKPSEQVVELPIYKHQAKCLRCYTEYEIAVPYKFAASINPSPDIKVLEEVMDMLRVRHSRGIHNANEVHNLHRALIESDIDPQHVGREALLFCLAETLIVQKQALAKLDEYMKGNVCRG